MLDSNKICKRTLIFLLKKTTWKKELWEKEKSPHTKKSDSPMKVVVVAAEYSLLYHYPGEYGMYAVFSVWNLSPTAATATAIACEIVQISAEDYGSNSCQSFTSKLFFVWIVDLKAWDWSCDQKNKPFQQIKWYIEFWAFKLKKNAT